MLRSLWTISPGFSLNKKQKSQVMVEISTTVQRTKNGQDHRYICNLQEEEKSDKALDVRLILMRGVALKPCH
jgi:hypothetical protein